MIFGQIFGTDPAARVGYLDGDLVAVLTGRDRQPAAVGHRASRALRIRLPSTIRSWRASPRDRGESSGQASASLWIGAADRIELQDFRQQRGQRQRLYVGVPSRAKSFSAVTT